MVFHTELDRDLDILCDWLDEADALLGHFICFDIMYLRAYHPRLRSRLQPSRIALIDTGILNYLSSEDRTERSLKALCRLFGIFHYDRTLSEGRFPSPADGEFVVYQASDPHATTLLGAKLSDEIVTLYGLDSPKCQPDCLSYFSDCLWGAIRYNEAGLPMSQSALQRLEKKFQAHADYARRACHSRFNLKLGNYAPGITHCMKSQDAFIKQIIHDTTPPGYDDPDETRALGLSVPPPHPILDHNCLEVSDGGRISWTNLNRDLFRGVLPGGDPRRQALMLANEEAFSSKMLSSFITKLLYHRSKHPEDVADKLLPCQQHDPDLNPDTLIGYPFVRVIPSPSKDDADDDRGQRQCRPSWTHPPAQTFHKVIRQYQSRWHGGVILSWDQSQHELRTAGVLSHDAQLVKVFQEGLDPHAETAKHIWGDSIQDHPRFKSLYRQAAKHSNFEMLNLGGADTLQHTILNKGGFLYPIEDCRRLVNSRKTVYPDLARWQDQIVAQAQRDGFLTLPITGHSRCYLGETEPTKIVNFPIQGIAAVTVWYILHRAFAKSLPDIDLQRPLALPILNHYDAGLFDCRDPAAADWMQQQLYDSMKWVEQSGYWARICEHYGAFIPLEGEATIIKVTA
jgi:hypothetical protein